MNKLLKLILCILLFLSPCFLLPAYDFGLVIDQTAGYTRIGSDGEFDYAGSIIPRVSALIGDNADIYASASFEVDYLDEWTAVPELLRTDFFMGFGNFGFRIGRMYYSDPLEYIAEGLFDGFNVSYDTEFGAFNIGAWYTGLLYKNRAKIHMTLGEYADTLVKLDYDHFSDTYFAPRRLLSAISWEHLGMVGSLRGKAAFLGQFDLTGSDELVHSQYLVGKVALPFSSFTFDVGACLELIEDDGDFGLALAAELGVSWIPPTPFGSRLSLVGRFSSGGVGSDTFKAFLPVTTEYQSEVLKPKFSGISMITLDYIATLHDSFAAGLYSTYFIRSDLGTYIGYPWSINANDNYFLGNEFFLKLLWNPVSDLQFNLGGGVFLPSMGNVAPSADALWRVELNVIISLF